MQQSSLNKNVNNNGISYSGNGNATFYLPAKFEISADVRYTYNPSTPSFDQSFEQTIVNTSLSKSFFKANNLKLNLAVNDLLNQNTGFQRFASASTITQTKYNTIQRYFMFSVIWDFNKMGGIKK